MLMLDEWACAVFMLGFICNNTWQLIPRLNWI